MRKLSYFLMALLSIGVVVTSCSNDVTMDENQPATRSYDQDAELLSKFVSINKSEGTYFVDDSKKVTVLSYITDQDWKELQKVNPLNRTMYENELKTLNAELAAVAQRKDVAQIVYSTMGETWIRNINTDREVNIEVARPSETVATRATVATFSFFGDGYLVTSDPFTSGRQLRSSIELLHSGYKYYFFEISCETATKQGPAEGGSYPNAVVLSGVAQYYLTSDYIWTTTKSGNSVTWQFKGKMRSPTDDYAARVKVELRTY